MATPKPLPELTDDEIASRIAEQLFDGKSPRPDFTPATNEADCDRLLERMKKLGFAVNLAGSAEKKNRILRLAYQYSRGKATTKLQEERVEERPGRPFERVMCEGCLRTHADMRSK